MGQQGYLAPDILQVLPCGREGVSHCLGDAPCTLPGARHVLRRYGGPPDRSEIRGYQRHGTPGESRHLLHVAQVLRVDIPAVARGPSGPRPFLFSGPILYMLYWRRPTEVLTFGGTNGHPVHRHHHQPLPLGLLRGVDPVPPHGLGLRVPARALLQGAIERVQVAVHGHRRTDLVRTPTYSVCPYGVVLCLHQQLRGA